VQSADRVKRLSFIEDSSAGIEIVSLEHVSISYPPHTHTGHYAIGIVTDGEVSIKIADQVEHCRSGEFFVVHPDVCHSISPVSECYSMITLCIPCDETAQGKFDILKKRIIGNPELEMSVDEMSRKVHISSFHMIRSFASENGLTPHKFQMQCRIRKAQDLLKKGYRVSDVAQMVGFCDQSHLDRVFRKQVGITPEEFSRSAILSNAD
jgi:AraC-like DNA-binding protein